MKIKKTNSGNESLDIVIFDSVLSEIEEQSRDDSKEFFGFLSGRLQDEEFVIENVAFNPYVASKESAMSLGFMGTDTQGFVGTVHTHPGISDITPSGTDLQTFNKFSINIIGNKTGFKVFDRNGQEIKFEIRKDKRSETGIKEAEKIQRQIMEQALSDKSDEKDEKFKSVLRGVVRVVFVLMVLFLLVMWYFV
ncbi:MAG: Mov34/MPN/PAD-1 family protein [Nanoarchaeota archaeon]|nr:Mov34/MPN/PAD-1 family protein [Nanoarchaeota archaeon]